MYLNNSIRKSRWNIPLLKNLASLKSRKCFCSSESATSANPQLHELCSVISTALGGLNDLESSLSHFKSSLTSSLVTQVIDFCENQAPTRRLLRFFLWSHKNLKLDLQGKDYNHAIRVFAEKKDHTALGILIADLEKNGREMETKTYSIVAEALVKLGKEDEAIRIFKNLDKYQCLQDSSAVIAIVSALCSHGHAKKAEHIVWLHRDKISGFEQCIYRSILYGWSEQENVKEARRTIKEMKQLGFAPDLFCFNTLLRGLCEQNLKRNPSGLVPEALNVMMEMRSYNITPNYITYNILLSCLGRARRVKESCQILERMKATGCSPDWTSYYLVVRVLFLSMRFGKGNKFIDEMLDLGFEPNRKFYYDLISVLCGVERPYYALELFEKMKRSSIGGYGKVYDLLIPKLCYGGDFEKGRELWDEAKNTGVDLRCSVNVLDSSITEVYKSTGKEEIVRIPDRAPVELAEENNKRRTGKKKTKKEKKKKKKNVVKSKKKKTGSL